MQTPAGRRSLWDFVGLPTARFGLLAGGSVTFGYLLANHPELTLLGAVAFTTALGLGIVLTIAGRSELPAGWLLVSLFFASGLALRIRTTDSAANEALDQAALIRVTLVALVGIGLLAFFARAGDVGIADVRLGAFGPLVAFSAWALLSTSWSVNPPWTLYRSLEYLLGVLLFATISTTISSRAGVTWHHEARRLSGVVWVLLGLLLSSAIISALLVPSRGIVSIAGVLGFSFEGVFPAVSRNGVGALSGMLALVLLARFAGSTHKRFALYFAGISVCLVILLISQTRSALLGFLAGVAVMFIARRKYLLAGVACALIALALVFVPAADRGVTSYLQRGQAAQQLQTLSGRVNYWDRAWQITRERPIEGFGAYAAGRFLVAKDFDPTLSSTHGSWPEVMVGQGVIGLLTLATAVLLAGWSLVLGLRRARNRSNQETWLLIEALAVLAFLVVRSVFTVSLIWHPAVDFLAITLIADVSRRSVRTEFARVSV